MGQAGHHLGAGGTISATGCPRVPTTCGTVARWEPEHVSVYAVPLRRFLSKVGAAERVRTRAVARTRLLAFDSRRPIGSPCNEWVTLCMTNYAMMARRSSRGPNRLNISPISREQG